MYDYLSGPLAMEGEYLNAFVRQYHAILRDMSASFTTDTQARSGEVSRGNKTVAVIPVLGAIANRGGWMGVGADQIGAAVDAAVNSARVDAIVFDVDSPGGTVTGIPELADKIMGARKVKPTVAVANGMMASAAYWIGAAAGEIVSSPSSKTGSIGVYMVHEDWTENMEAQGVKITEVSAGKYKTEGAPWKALDEEAEAQIHTEVTEAYNWFVRDVARFRGASQAAVREGYGEGRVVSAEAAVKAGLADRVGTLEETIDRLAGGGSVRRGGRGDDQARKIRRARG